MKFLFISVLLRVLFWNLKMVWAPKIHNASSNNFGTTATNEDLYKIHIFSVHVYSYILPFSSLNDNRKRKKIPFYLDIPKCTTVISCLVKVSSLTLSKFLLFTDFINNWKVNKSLETCRISSTKICRMCINENEQFLKYF